MQIEYLKHKDIDKEKWDACIKNAPNGNVYAYSWYLDIVSKDWDALIAEDYLYVFPITWRKKFGIKYLFQPPFSQQLGLFSRRYINNEILELFLKNIPTCFKIIEINLNKNCKEPLSYLNVKENATYELDLIYTYSEIYNGYTENTIRNVKKAQKKDVYLSKYIRPDDITKLFIANRGAGISTLNNREYLILHKLIDEAIKRNCGESWGAFNEHNELCAAAFFINANGKIIFLFSAINSIGRNNGAMFLIIDNFIRLNSEKPFVFDFEGSNDENLARFYKGFGSKKYSYYSIHSNNLPYLVRLFHNYYKRLKYK